MRLAFRTNDLAKLADSIGIAKRKYQETVREALLTFGEREVERLKKQIDDNHFRLWPKEEGVPLIDTSVYRDSYTCTVLAGRLAIYSAGMQEDGKISNEELAEVLEYGYGRVPPMPHLRPFSAGLRTRFGYLMWHIRERVFKRLQGG